MAKKVGFHEVGGQRGLFAVAGLGLTRVALSWPGRSIVGDYGSRLVEAGLQQISVSF